MNDAPRTPDQQLDNDSSDVGTSSNSVQTLRPLPPEAADKSEHVPPIIIKSGSFQIDLDSPFIPPSGVFQPPFHYQYPFPFALRGIRVIGSPFGSPETLFYLPDPVDCKIELELRTTTGFLRLTIADILVGSDRTLRLTTHDHQLPPQLPGPDPFHEHRCLYAADDTVKLNVVTIRNASNQILYQTSATLDFFISIWRRHGH